MTSPPLPIDLRSAYCGQRVLLTGHTGFKGSWLVALLQYLEAVVSGIALTAEPPSLFQDIRGDQQCHSVIADIRDQSAVSEVVKTARPDLIFHLAAQPLVLPSYQDPLYTYEVNVLGTVNLLLAVRQLDDPCQVVIVTTDKVYANREWFYPYRENDPLGGHDPYSSSKACVEIVVDSLRRSFFPAARYKSHRKSVATARSGNVIGGGDWAQHRLIPDFVRAARAGTQLKLRSPGSVRPWQHVLESLTGYLSLGSALAQAPDSPELNSAWNFGPSNEDVLSVREVLTLAQRAWGDARIETVLEESGEHEARMLKLDSSKAHELLGWRPRMGAEQAIDWTVQWYKEVVVGGAPALDVTRRQIEAFLHG